MKYLLSFFHCDLIWKTKQPKNNKHKTHNKRSWKKFDLKSLIEMEN